LTSSSSFGTRDKKSNNSLFGIVLGLSIRRENFIIPQKSSRKRMGIKCNTIIATISRTTANQPPLAGSDVVPVIRRINHFLKYYYKNIIKNIF
uniref:Uncharacterized protein n=1 Tax=Glossina palpalis gambiensis TaxID=67801 RepID=A0A1B0AMI9_9MUSC